MSTLKSTGPFTVFAPTDAAFAKLPTVVVNELLNGENKVTLRKILLYHVQNGNVTSSVINAANLSVPIQMLANSSVTVSRNGTVLRVNNAVITKPDVYATNGIIHAIDAVLLPPFDIVETAITNGNFQTLVAALRVADLVNTLKAAGPFTVFAPTDAAFAKLSAGTRDDLLKPENKGKLSNILKYHVINGRVAATSINNTVYLTTLAGSSVVVKKEGDAIKLNGATVTVADVSTTNGVIHAIDAVLLPPFDIVETAITIENFQTLVAALRVADLVNTLKATGPFTVFAPTDAAFAKLSAGTRDDLLKSENKEKSSNILKYHVISGRVVVANISGTATMTTLAGGTVVVKKEGSTIKVNKANITGTVVPTTNGLIYCIDIVLMPPGQSSSANFISFNQGLFNILVLAVFVYNL